MYLKNMKTIPVLLVSAVLAACSGSEKEVSFKRDVLPVLAEKCMPCHAPGGRGVKRTGLRLDSYEALMKGSDEGAMVSPGDTGKSPLSVFIHPTPDASMQMPFGGKNKLTKTEIDRVDAWIRQGAKDN